MKITISVKLPVPEALKVMAVLEAIGLEMGDVTADEEVKPAADKKAATAAQKKAATAAKKKAEEEAAPEGPTRDDVRTALKEYAALEGKDAAIQILKDNGAASIGELDEDKFQTAIDACG